MTRNRKPVEIHELNGSYNKNPQRRLPPPPKSNQPAGDPPEHLDQIEAVIWHEALRLVPHGVITEADRYMLALFCQLEKKARKGSLTAIERGQMISLLARMGMTPADRSRISPVPAGRKDDEFAEFA